MGVLVGSGRTFGTDSGVGSTRALIEARLPAVREERTRLEEELAAVIAQENAMVAVLEGLAALSDAPLGETEQAQAAPQAPEAPRTAMPAPETLTDEAITSKIGAALQADPAMKGADVSVNTDHGVVVLSGTVKSHEQTGVASAHAQSQDGVLRVENNLRPQLS